MKTRMLENAPYSLEMGRLDKNVKTALCARSEARRRAVNTEGGGVIASSKKDGVFTFLSEETKDLFFGASAEEKIFFFCVFDAGRRVAKE